MARLRRGAAARIAVSLTVLLTTFGVFAGIAQPSGSASEPILFGADVGMDANSSRLAALDAMETALGRDLGLVRVFERWDSQWSTPFHDSVESGDAVMLLSVKAKRTNGAQLSWRNIADASSGSALHDEMLTWVDRVKQFDGEVWFAFHHEPESSSSVAHGTNDDFIDAYRRFVAEFRAEGVTNVEFVWIMTYWSFATSPSDTKHADKWYPGDEWVDHIASDAYNWDFCRGGTTDPWQSLEDVIEPQREFGLQHPDKGLILAEWASTEKDGDGGVAKAAWIDEAAALFSQPGWEQFVALSYFNVMDPAYPECEWPADSTDAAFAAFVEMASDPYYGASQTADPSTTTGAPTTTTATTTSPTTTTTVAPTTTTDPPQPPLSRPPRGGNRRPRPGGPPGIS